MGTIQRIASVYLRLRRVVSAERPPEGDGIRLSKEDEGLLSKIWEEQTSRTKKADGEEAEEPGSKGSVFGSDAFKEFWQSKYQGGKKKVPNTDSKTKARYKEVSANTLLGKDKEFRKKVLEEFRKWNKGSDSKDSSSGGPKGEETRYKDKEFSYQLGDEEDTRELLKEYGLSVEDVADAAGLSGLPPTVKRVRVLANTTKGTVRIIAGDGKDPPMGWKMDRTVDLESGEITNELFFVPKDSPPGTGLRVFGGQVEAARKHGFKKIKTNAYTAPDWVGGLVWPKLGYDAPLPTSLVKKAEKFLKGSPKPWKVSDLMRSGKEAQEFWKENVPAEVNMEFDLGKDSLGSRVLGAYMKAKGL
jgi:hypothetical protein